MPELAGTLDLEEPRPPPPGSCVAALDQPALTHHPQHPLAVHRRPSLRDTQAVTIRYPSVGLALATSHDRLLDLIDRRAPGASGGRRRFGTR